MTVEEFISKKYEFIDRDYEQEYILRKENGEKLPIFLKLTIFNTIFTIPQEFVEEYIENCLLFFKSH
jgi:hypothetical protein